MKKTSMLSFLRKATPTQKPAKKEFAGSGKYWESRYQNGRDSGTGSYGRLAEFKAEVLNDFVAKTKISSVIELGCGDGNQLNLADYPRYTGLDISKTAIKTCGDRFSTDNTKSFFWYHPDALIDRAGILCSDLALSLDVIFHLVEDEVYGKYMETLFSLSHKYIVIYSSNQEDDGNSAVHVRHRRFTYWIKKQAVDWKLIKQIDNKYPFDPSHPGETTFADFYIYGRK